jgi:hypothetical protein
MTLFSGPTGPTQARVDRRASRYDKRRARTDARDREASKAGRDIGPIPAVAAPDRRQAARLDFATFAATYQPATFSIPWSDDHRKVISRIEAAVLRGELFAFAMPRGSGKTSLAIAAALWALVYAHRAFVVVIGADEGHARRMLEALWIELETNDRLAADFPEVTKPIRALERTMQRCRGQLLERQPTRIEKTAGHFVLPTVPGAATTGATLRAVGITASLRGLTHKRADGSTIRPDLVLIDDPQTDEVSGSPKQIADRLDILRGAVLGLAGPGRDIAGLCTVTVIKPNDLADQLLDRERNPAWQGERASLVYAWPEAEELWQQYADLRREGQRAGTGPAAANAFYAENRERMEAGAVVGWRERHHADELSAIQHAYNLRIDRGEAAFFAEYQNQPLLPVLEAAAIDPVALRSRSLSLARGIVPNEATTLTIGVDVQERVLYWLVAAWGEGFTGHIVAYGTAPEQPQTAFTAGSAKRTLAGQHKGGFEAALAAGLEALADLMLARDWKREDGTTQRIAAMLVDAGWGRSTNTVRAFARRHQAAGIIYPCHGRGVTASATPINELRRRPGERMGPGWRVSMIGGQRGATFDTNHWKSFLAARLNTAVGDPGAISFHAGEHDMLIDHLAAERPVSVTARGRTIDEWKLAIGAENHWLDCLAMATVAASINGIAAPGAELAGRRRKKVTIPQPGERRVIQTKPWR